MVRRVFVGRKLRSVAPVRHSEQLDSYAMLGQYLSKKFALTEWNYVVLIAMH